MWFVLTIRAWLLPFMVSLDVGTMKSVLYRVDFNLDTTTVTAVLVCEGTISDLHAPHAHEAVMYIQNTHSCRR